MNALNDVRNWKRRDPRTGVPLDDIELVSERALSLLARSSTLLLNDNYIQVSGAVSMLAGMDYHYENFRQIVSKIPHLPHDSTRHISMMRHEGIAWINRVGQFHALSKSKLIKSQIGLQQTSKIDDVMPFRNKHTAHRSIDAPRGEDTDYFKFSHATIFNSGVTWIPRQNISEEDLSMQSIRPGYTHCPVFQIQLAGGVFKQLNIEEDHPNVITECYSILEKLLQ